MPFCTSCGSPVDGSAKFCPKCGTKLASAAGGSSPSTAKFNSSPKSSPKTNSHSPSTITLPGRATPPVRNVVTGSASGEQSTAYYATNTPGTVKGGLPPPTYGQQPSWAYAEQHKNKNLQYKDGQFRSHNI